LLGARNMDLIPQECVYNDVYLPSHILDSSATLLSTASFGNREFGSSVYREETSRTSQQFLIETQKLFGVKGSHIVGKKAKNFNQQGEFVYSLEDSALSKPLVMHVVLERTDGMNNTTIGDLQGPWPYYQNLAPCDGFGSLTSDFFDGATTYTYDAGATNFIAPSRTYQADSSVIRFEFTPPVVGASSGSFTLQEALWGSNTTVLSWKTSIAKEFGILSSPGSDLRDSLIITTGPQGEPIFSLKGENLSAILNTTGSTTTAPAAPATAYNHALLGSSPYVSNSVRGTNKGIYFSIYGPEFNDGTIDESLVRMRPANVSTVGSLASVLGLENSKLVGDVDDIQHLEEGVAFIPIQKDDCEKTKFFDIPEDRFFGRLLYLQLKGRLKYEYFEEKELESISATQDINKIREKDNYIDDLIMSMEKYVWPIELDFLRTIRMNKDLVNLRGGKIEWLGEAINPFIAFSFDMQQKWTIDQRIAAWQGNLPDLEAERLQQTITFDMQEVFGKKVPKDLRALTFKIKKRAEHNYDNFINRRLGKETYREIDDGISHNWPYDEFTLVEYAKIKATLSCTNRDKDYEKEESE